MRTTLLVILILTTSACKADVKYAQKINQKIENFSSSTTVEIADNSKQTEVLQSDFRIASQKDENSTSTYYTVTKVVDGDTIYVNQGGKIQKIRLIGINTPETVDPRKPVECFGKEASNIAKEWLLGNKVRLGSDPTQDNADRYGRLLRYVTTEDGLFYNLEIIRQGYAYEYTYKYPYKFQKEFKQAQDHAKDNNLGLWASCKVVD